MELLALVLAGLAMVGPFSIDSYLPAFPAIARDFSLTPLEVQQTMSAYLVTFAVMMLFHGTLSDSFGRRPVILANLAVFVVATLGCAFARDFVQLLAFPGSAGRLGRRRNGGRGAPSSAIRSKASPRSG
jgi:DHA1 family bicyclomycin/chloramphenicol resistance-like MFS transporter